MKKKLSLPETGLHVTDSALVRQTTDNEVTLSLPLESIVQLRLARVLNEFSVALLGAALAIVYLAVEVADGTGLRVGLSLLAVLVCVFSLIGLFKEVLIVESHEGRIRVDAGDSRDVCEGFVYSVNALLTREEKVSGTVSGE